MINLTVLSLKDIGKYLFKIAIVIFILWLFSRIISIVRLRKINIPINIDKEELLEVIDSQIPGIKQSNNNENMKEKEIVNPLKAILQMELGIVNNIEKKDEDTIDGNLVNNDNLDSYMENIAIKQAETGLDTKVIENDVPTSYTDEYGSVQIKNGTDYNLTDDILKPDIEVSKENIIIFHTHTCESYTPTEKFNYEETGTFRTTDLNYSVARVGDELTNQLKSYNYNVIHDITYHDYPAYSGSYGRSLETVKTLLAGNKNTDVIIDLHRDAIADYSYAPTVKIGEEYASQLMFVIGTDGGGLEHPNWDQNLKFAIKVQEKANELYPGLFKPILLRNSRYNQHLSKAACIIEVGATGNTMEQCLVSMKYLAKVINETIN